ncbi:hypothetical protein Tco_0747878 [Tanacetum coccineum]|uniref:Uncharacterized protein n=1 Tax=Tanacetum coccineum TaxID=301880 RepID=A0ABQ4YWR1_9ASTR
MSANDNFSLHDDEELSLHDDASLNGSEPVSNKGDAPAKPPQIITTNTLSNIKLPVLQKDDYDTWAMEMEHYLEYIDNEVWKVIQNGNSKKRVTKGKDGVYRVLPPSTQTEQVADEKEKKARTLLLMAVPKDHLRRFHGMDDAKEIWAAIKTRFGGNANSKKMQKAVLKQQFEAFTISSKESLEKGYDRFQKLLSQLDALGASVSDEDANHKFLRSLPPAWDSLAMTMRTKKNIDTLSIDDLYNNLSVFEQDIQKTSSSSLTSEKIPCSSLAEAMQQHVLNSKPFTVIPDMRKHLNHIIKCQRNHSDHAGCLDSRKSTSGGIQFLGGDKLVSWSSKKQDCTSMSSAKADTWMTFGGNTHDLGSFGEETDKTTYLHQNLLKNDAYRPWRRHTSIKRHRRDLSSDGVEDLTTASGRNQLKSDLEDSTW